MSTPRTVCERFGNAPPYYFTLWNENTPGESTRITIDLKKLGLSASHQHLREIAWKTPLRRVQIDSRSVLLAELDLRGNRTAVLRLSDRPETE